MATIEIIGLKEANAALRKLPEFAKVQAQQTMDVTAFQVAQQAAARAPVRTGLLKDSIQWRSRPRSLSAVVGVLARAFYWKFLEYGTVKLSPRPFLRPAADAMRADHHARLLQALEKAATQVERSQGVVNG